MKGRKKSLGRIFGKRVYQFSTEFVNIAFFINLPEIQDWREEHVSGRGKCRYEKFPLNVMIIYEF